MRSLLHNIRVVLILVVLCVITNGTFAQDLILTDQRLNDLKGEYLSDPVLREYVDNSINHADYLLTQSLPSAGSSMLSTARNTLESLSNLGFAYRWTSDTKYASRAQEILLTVSGFSNWNPGHFLDAAEMGMAVSIGLNWVKDYVGDSNKNIIYQAIIDKTLSPGIDQMNSGAYWSWIDNNWNIICHTGMIISSLGVENYNDYYSGVVIPAAISNLDYPLQRFNPDGTWDESMDYLKQSINMYSYLTASLLTWRGDDYGLLDYPGMATAGEFYYSNEGKNKKWFCYADVYQNMQRQLAPGLFFLGSTFNNQQVIANEQDFIDRKNNNGVFHVIWYEKSNVALATSDNSYYGGDNSFFYLNNERENNDAIYLAIKAGKNGTSHSHLDMGNFAFDAVGVRWARDLGSDNYGLPGFFDFSTDDGQRWTYYRNGSLSHNVPIINESNQKVNSQGYFTSYSATGTDPYCVMNIQDAYRDYASGLERGIKLVDDRRSMIIQDEYSLYSSQDCYSGITTDASISIVDSKTAILSQDGEQLYAMIVSPSNAYFQERAAIREDGGYPVYDAKRLIAYKPSDGNLNFTICIQLSPVWDGYHTPEQALVPLVDWGTTLPYAPTNVNATTISTTQIDLSWDASVSGESIVGYNIYRDNTLITTLDALNFSDVGLNPGTEYAYELSSVDADDQESSRTSAIRISTQSIPDNTAPSAPSNLIGNVESAFRISLSWDTSTDNVAVLGYNIYRDGEKIAQTSSLSYSDNSLTPVTTYEYTVTAYDAADNESTESNLVTATTLTNDDTQAPTAPSDLSGTAVSPSEIMLYWDSSTDNVGIDGYIIYRGGIEIARVEALQYSDGSVSASSSYQYTVSAYDESDNESTASNMVTINTPADEDTQNPTAPSNLVGTPLSTTEIALDWDGATDNIGVVGYVIYRNAIEIARTPETEFIDATAAVFTAYQYKVTAYDAAGNQGIYSNAIIVSTFALDDSEAPSAPVNLMGSPLSPTEIELNWGASTDNVGVEGYIIYRDDIEIGRSATTTFSDSDAAASTAYHYKVSAYDLAGNESGFSNTILITTFGSTDSEAPSIPGGLSAEVLSHSSVKLTWSASSDNISVAKYKVYRDSKVITSVEDLEFTDVELTADTEYSYSVTAVDGAGNESAHSELVSAMTSSAPKTVYINPESNSSSNPDGSLEHPYTSWSQIKLQEGYTYLQQRNTVCYEPKILITESNIKLGAYGNGERPKIISSAEDHALSIYDKKNVSIANLEILSPSAISGIYFIGDECDSNLVEGCSIRGGEFGLRIIGGNNYSVRYNEFEAELNAVFTMASSTKIYYNEFASSETAIHANDYSCEIEAFNNVFVDNMQAISSSYGGLTLHNNIFSLERPGSIAISQELDEIVSDYNIFYPMQPGFVRIGNSSYDDLDTYQTEESLDVNSKDEDPLFANMHTGDFTLKNGSPAIEAGVYIGVDFDKFGSAVPYGNFPDIGVQETDILLSNRVVSDSYNYNLDIFPNPSSGTFMMSMNATTERLSEVMVFNEAGKKMYSSSVDFSESAEFDLSFLDAGNYIILVNTNNQQFAEKLIIVK